MTASFAVYLNDRPVDFVISHNNVKYDNKFHSPNNNDNAQLLSIVIDFASSFLSDSRHS